MKKETTADIYLSAGSLFSFYGKTAALKSLNAESTIAAFAVILAVIAFSVKD